MMITIQKPSFLLFHILLLFFLPLKITSSSPTTQAEALIKWQNTLSPPPPPLNSQSLTNLSNLYNWTAIVCHTTGSISEINLSNANLSGTLTQFNFISFPTLTSLDLSSNNFCRSIPAAFGNLSKLNYLDLGHNNFEDIIPSELGLCTNLNMLALAGNNLSGVLPLSLSNLTKITDLPVKINPTKYGI